MAHEAHEEFPLLTQDAEELLLRVEQALHPGVDRKDEPWGQEERTLAAAVIREAKRQAARGDGFAWSNLDLIADNLHSPPPAPPTREEMLKALQELENWQRIEVEAMPAAGVSAGKRLEILRRGIAHYCKD